jgi:hypothetical protein
VYDYLKTPASWILQTPRRPAVVSVTQVGFWALVRFEIPGWSKLSSGGCGLVQGSNSLSRGFDILAHAEGMECGVPRMHVGSCATAESCVTQHDNPTVQGAAKHAKELMPSVAAKTGEPRLMSVLLPIRSTHNTHVSKSTILLPPQPELTSPPTTKEGVLRDLLGSIDGGAEAVATAPPQPELASRPSTEVVPRDPGESSIDGGAEAEAVATAPPPGDRGDGLYRYCGETEGSRKGQYKWICAWKTRLKRSNAAESVIMMLLFEVQLWVKAIYYGPYFTINATMTLACDAWHDTGETDSKSPEQENNELNGIVLTTAEQVGEATPQLIAQTYTYVSLPQSPYEKRAFTASTTSGVLGILYAAYTLYDKYDEVVKHMSPAKIDPVEFLRIGYSARVRETRFQRDIASSIS